MPASSLYDFVSNFHFFTPKSLTKSARDQAIVDALGTLDAEVLKADKDRLLKVSVDATS